MYVAILLLTAIIIRPSVARITMAEKPNDLSQRFRILATGMYVAADRMLVMTLMTGMSEWLSNLLVTNGVKVSDMDPIIALQKYNNHMLVVPVSD